MSDDPVAIFLVEAGEMLEQVEQGLLDLGERMDDRSLIDAVFRGLHTLKGSGAMFGFDDLAAFTHHCETAFDRVRKGEVAVTKDLVSTVLSAQDHMRALLDHSGDPATGTAILARLAAVVTPLAAEAPATATAPAPAVAAAGGGVRLTFRLPADVMTCGTNPLALLAELASLAPAVVTVSTSGVPPLATLDPTECHLIWTVDLHGPVDRAAIDDVFIFVTDGLTLSVEPLDPPAAAPAPPAAAPAPPEATPAPPVAAATASAPAATDPRPGAKAIESVRVPAERLDELMDRVGELVIAQSRLSQHAGSGADLALRGISEEIQRLANELRDTMMVLRMVPVGTLFSRFRRLVHDLQHETGKSLDLVTEGETTEIDKTVVERLSDPLVHLIRNACDHGLEPPAARTAAGKPQAGRVTVTAGQTGSEVVITVADDGRGMDRAAIRAKAEAGGLIQPGQSVSDQDLLQMIFQPGFSTAATVTNLSGRGVGMDVVKRTIEMLRGTIEVASTPGQGSRVTLRIPQTLAIIEGLLVRIGTGRFVIPLSAVEECLELSPAEDERLRDRSFVTRRNRLVPFLRLRELFATATDPDPFQKLIVVSAAGERVGLVVDQIIGSHQTVIKAMSPLHRALPAFAGATILGDGGVALIVDVPALIALAQPPEERLRAAS